LYYSKGGNSLVPFEETPLYGQVTCLAAAIEIAHNASLLQDDIIDHADSRRGTEAGHRVFGKATSIFASDFMIARAVRMLAQINSDSVHVSQLYSTVLANLVYGELIQAKRDMGSSKKIGAESHQLSFDTTNYFESYIAKTYYKTASMISLGCRGVGVIMGFRAIQE
jgi:hexaprenyl-diphosphate synthase